MADQDDKLKNQDDQLQGWYGDSEEDARVDGDKVATDRDPQFYSEIGEDSGETAKPKKDEDRTGQS